MIDAIAVGLTKEYIAKKEFTYETNKESKDFGKIIGQPKNPTIWIIGAIDSIQKAQIMAAWVDVQVVDGQEQLIRNKQNFTDSDFEIVRFGLKGFTNFQCKGVEVIFKTEKRKLFNVEFDVASDETIRQIPLAIIRELADAIWNENHVNEDLAKNSN